MTEADHVLRVCALLNRETAISALPSLMRATKFELTPVPLDQTVISFDSSIILRLGKHPRGDDIVDYLRVHFPGKIVFPGQVVQEFWNNQLQAVMTVAAAVEKKLGELEKLIGVIDGQYGDFHQRFSNLVVEFRDTFGYIFDGNTISKTRSIIDLFAEKAVVAYMPRNELQSTAGVRKRTKTPPGFEDNLDGDFYVWADLLLGLSQVQAQGATVKRVILVTLDKKMDWSRDGIPHPILSAEIDTLCGAQFETINIDNLAKKLLD